MAGGRLVVEPEAGKAGRVPQRPPGGRSLLRRLGRVVMVVLARAPDVMHRLRVAEFVRAVEHLRDGLSRRAAQRDLTLARLVLVVPDVKHALTRGAFDVSHLV